MNRIVRDMKQKLGKDVRLTIIGEDTEVDKTIVDSIQDLLCILSATAWTTALRKRRRNGLKPAKQPKGEIILQRLPTTSSEVVISVSDDAME